LTSDNKNSKLSRRDFLVASGAVATGTAVSALTSGQADSATTTTTRKKYAMVIDARRCYGVHACTVACKAEYKVPLGENRSWVEEVEKGSYPTCTPSALVGPNSLIV